MTTTKIITTAMVWTVDNVKSFRGYDVSRGEIDLSDSEYSDVLDDIYGDIEVCGGSYSAGSALEALDPVAFRCGKGDEEGRLQTELEEAIDNEDDSDIVFSEYDPSDINEDEEEDAE